MLEQFLTTYANLTPKVARELVAEAPETALSFAHRVKNRILNDKGVSEEFKRKIQSYEEI